MFMFARMASLLDTLATRKDSRETEKVEDNNNYRFNAQSHARLQRRAWRGKIGKEIQENSLESNEHVSLVDLLDGFILSFSIRFVEEERRDALVCSVFTTTSTGHGVLYWLRLSWILWSMMCDYKPGGSYNYLLLLVVYFSISKVPSCKRSKVPCGNAELVYSTSAPPLLNQPQRASAWW